MNASRVPEVGGGPSTSMSAAGSFELTSAHVVYGFGDELLAARGIGNVLGEREVDVAQREIEVRRTVFALREHDAVVSRSSLRRSDPRRSSCRSRIRCRVMRREEFAMSGCSTPTPSQNALMPPPVPVDSIFGVLNLRAAAELLGDDGGERIDRG